MTVNALLDDVCCACFPAASLAGLASLRTHAGIRVRAIGDRAWLWWKAGDEIVLRRVLALHGVEVFARRQSRWYRPGQHLPAFEVPDDEGAQPLLQILTPAPVLSETVVAARFQRADEWQRSANRHVGNVPPQPLILRLVRDDRIRPASALCCALANLAEWADQATSKQLAMLMALRASERVLLRGERLPPLLSAERYWGRSILTPLGFRPEPEASEGVLREALRLQEEEIALLGESGFEAIDARRFQPLTRAGVRRAMREER